MVPGGDLGSFPAAFLLVEALLPEGELGSGLALRGWKSSAKQDGRTGTVPFSLVPLLNMPASFCRGLLFGLFAPGDPALPVLPTLPVLCGRDPGDRNGCSNWCFGWRWPFEVMATVRIGDKLGGALFKVKETDKQQNKGSRSE